jgi:anaerobic ribonucleoside-triphosphate reductase activating protein
VKLFVESITPGVSTLGPGTRIGLWVQGCTLDCPGCISPGLFQRRLTSSMHVREVAAQVLNLAAGHTGLTVSGGEPFQQALGLGELLSEIKAESNLDILMYSGYRLSELRNGSKAVQRLLSLADILIDGRYRRDLPTNLLWRGSANQVIHLLTQRAQRYEEYVKAEYGQKRSLQIEFTADRRLRLIGIPQPGRAFEVAKAADRRGCRLIESE